MWDCLPRRRDVQKDGIGFTCDAKALLAHILVSNGDQLRHLVLPELLDGLLGPLSVELDRVQVAGGSNGPQNSMRQRAAARTCNTCTCEYDIFKLLCYNKICVCV